MERMSVKMSRWAAVTGLALMFLMVFSVPTYAQSTATLKGTVTDATGASVPHAKIVIRNQNTGVEWPTQTDDQGNYQLAGLPVGVYRIEISAEKFKKTVLTDLKLDVSSTVVQDVKLELGSVTQETIVTGQAPLVENTTMAQSQVINQRTVQEIPLNGRHFVDLGLLIPGSVTPPANGFLTFPLRGQGSFAFNTAGQREDTVNFMINGINLNDEVQNQITFQPSINTVQEFKVDNSTYSAQYGRNSGAIVNIATRSGTNQFHGELFEFYRNNALDARNFFNPVTTTLPSGSVVPNPQSFFNRSNFGANAGGPIVRDKAFFFASYEAVRQRQGISIVTDVPTDAQRATATDPTVIKLLALIPHVNGADVAGNPAFLGSASAPVNIDQGTGDLQFNLGQNDRLHGYIAIQQDLRQEPTLQGNNLPGWGDTRESRRQIMTINENHIFSPTMANEARLGYNRIHITFAPNATLNPADFGINNGITAPVGLPQIAVSGALNIGGPNGFPQGRGDATVVFSDTLSSLHGRHSMAFGGEVRRFYNNNFAQSVGSFTFNAGPTPTTAIENFLAGKASSFSVLSGSSDSKILEPAWGIFAEDSFKLRSNFTLIYGLRFDWNSTPSEAANHFVVFNPATASLVQVGTNGLGEAFSTNNVNFQPRLGFAWDPFNDGKTSVRGGYAILTDQPVTNAVTGLAGNPPFATPAAVNIAQGVTFANALTLAAAGGLAPATINHDFKNPYVQSWNLTVERSLTNSLALSAGYIGAKATHLRIARNINQPNVKPFPTLSLTSPIQPCTTPPCALGNITQVDSGANSNYNALWLKANKRLGRGLQFNASYTFSKSLDYNSLNSQGVIVQDSFNIHNDYGLSDFDVRHRFVANAIYELPFKGSRFISGWQLGIITQAQSGNPLTILTGNTAFTGNATLRPNVSGPVTVTGNPSQWFVDKTVFSSPAAGLFGNLGRNAVVGPDFVNTDFSVIKNTSISERMKTQFRVEMFDVFNHPNFGNPNRTSTSSSFGVISGTRFPTGDFGSARQIQFALKLLF
jgi:Carboxypeptidase regulatory-like domain/TonB dependent receptor-like, beta-barrel